jgi:hypothetical protein
LRVNAHAIKRRSYRRFADLYGTFGAPCATDHNALLEALVWMTIDAEQAFEKDHSISEHGDCYRRSHRRQWVG